MNQPLLSILIPTTLDRDEQTKFLLRRIIGEDYDCDLYTYPTWKLTCGRYVSKLIPIEVLVYLDDKEMTIGEKRELLYKGAKGAWSWQIDSDDDISDDAIELILEAIKQEPDCITFEEYVSIDGREYKSNHSLSYPGWVGNGEYLLSDGFHFWRTPFFKSVIKTDIARSVPVPRIRWGEDNMWSDELQKHLKTEVHISKQLYLYKHISSPFNERYGIK